MIANNRRTETFDVQSLCECRFAAIRFVTGWANECVECAFGVTNGRLVRDRSNRSHRSYRVVPLTTDPRPLTLLLVLEPDATIKINPNITWKG